MKSFLDHYGWRWMVHRPEEKMFAKQAVCISTAVGAGMKSANKDMADSTLNKEKTKPCQALSENEDFLLCHAADAETRME